MKYLKVTLAICLLLLSTPMIRRAWAASCPGGSVCIQFSSYWATFTYVLTGGTTARSDLARWVDNWIEVPEAGIDCTGNTDSTSALQAAINATPDFSAVVVPIACKVLLSSTITITGRSGLIIESLQRVTNGNANSPELLWNATGGTMFDVENSSSPVFNGLRFALKSGKTIDKFLNFDGNGGPTSTQATVLNSTFDASGQSISSFKAISIAATATNNNEFAQVKDVYIICSGSYALLRATDGVTNSDHSLTSATASFVAGDVGKRLRVSYSGGLLDTTVASVTNSTTVVMTDAASFTQTAATIHIGQAYGTGIYNGTAQARGQSFDHVKTYQCAKGYDFEGGNFTIRNGSEGYNDIGVYVGSTGDTSEIAFDQSESSLQNLVVANNGGTIDYHDNRVDATNALAYGFFYFAGGGREIFRNNKGGITSSNFTLFDYGGVPTTPVMTFIANNWQPLTLAQLNYAGPSMVAVLNDVYGSNAVTSMWLGLPTSCSGLLTGSLRSNSGVLTLCPN